MKSFIFAFVAGSFLATLGFAGADDAAWIAKCKADNKGDNPDEVVAKYCSCMNNEMPDSETKSVSEWEKTPAGQTAEKKCEASSGWKK